MADAKRSLSTAPSQLRGARTKLRRFTRSHDAGPSARGYCRRSGHSGGDGNGYSAIVNVLAQAARLIQTKG